MFSLVIPVINLFYFYFRQESILVQTSDTYESFLTLSTTFAHFPLPCLSLLPLPLYSHQVLIINSQ